MRILNWKLLGILGICALSLGCNKEPKIEDHMLDGDLVFDPSLNDPNAFLVSAQFPNPSALNLQKHIIIAAHGFTASTFEWQEFRDWTTDTNYRVSQVLLGAHGRTFEEFRASSWEDWQESIKLEYETLAAQGYQNISLVGSSTGATLLLELVQSGYFESRQKPKNLFLVDAIVVPSIKLQSIAGIVGPMIVYIETDQSTEQDEYWYRFRPHETVSELNELMKKVRKGLEDGLTLPEGTYLKAFHSKHDPTANSLSAVLIHQGMQTFNGDKVDVQIMDSDIHVFTRLSLRDGLTQLNLDNQEDAFQQMADRLVN